MVVPCVVKFKLTAHITDFLNKKKKTLSLRYQMFLIIFLYAASQWLKLSQVLFEGQPCCLTVSIKSKC